MGLGSTAKKIQTVADTAEKMYRRLNALRKEVESTKRTVEDTGGKVDTLETEIAEQRVILEAIGEELDVDIDAVVDDADIGDDSNGDATENEEIAVEKADGSDESDDGSDDGTDSKDGDSGNDDSTDSKDGDGGNDDSTDSSDTQPRRLSDRLLSATLVGDQPLVFDFQTAILHRPQTDGFGLGERLAVGDTELEPDHVDITPSLVASDRVVDDAGDLLTRPEHVDNIDLGVDFVK